MGMHHHAVSIGQQVISHQMIAVIDAIYSRCLLYLGCSCFYTVLTVLQNLMVGMHNMQAVGQQVT